jgi:hypothetical protein
VSAESQENGTGQDRILQLGLGFWPAKVLLTAVELGVYSVLAADGPADATV